MKIDHDSIRKGMVLGGAIFFLGYLGKKAFLSLAKPVIPLDEEHKTNLGVSSEKPEDYARNVVTKGLKEVPRTGSYG